VGKNFFPHIFGFYLKATVSPQKDSLLTVALFCPQHSAPSTRFTGTGSSGRKIRFSAKSNNRLSTHYGQLCILFPRIITRILSDGGDIRSLPPQRLILLRLVRTLRVPSETEALCYFFAVFPLSGRIFRGGASLPVSGAVGRFPDGAVLE
jgi:hypothetical protein